MNNTFQLILDSLVPPHVWSQCKTSIIKGGLGIPDVHLIAVAAHTASCLEVLPHLVTSIPLDMLSDTNWFHNLSDSIDKYNSFTSTSPDDFLDLDSLVHDRLEGSGRDKLQHRLSLALSITRDEIS